MTDRLSGMFANFSTKAHVYHLAASGVWGIILALVCGVIKYNARDGLFDVGENWFLATIGLSAIMYAALSFLRNVVQVYKGSVKQDKEEIEAEQ